MANKDIIQELNNLGSSLAGAEPQNIYSTPHGYFEGFAIQVLNLIKANESLIWLSSLPKNTPYQVPDEYFNGLEERIIQAIRNHPDYQTSKEEMESLSPLLNSLNKRPVYSVPEGYFENFKIEDEEKEVKTKVVSISRKLYRYAAAAIIVGVIALGGLIVYNSNNNNRKDALAKFEKEVKKIDDVKKTESLIDLMDAGLNEKALASNHKTIKTDDVQQLLQDVSIDELKEFSEQSKDIEDVMMTN
ncbi:MAG TPA: hypothetical protein VGQ09_07130 [Chitinophagaceae bacterium]|jgi:hypothetical protein|nr:hypothetical protein [Chitinophagaceae bacterium]